MRHVSTYMFLLLMVLVWTPGCSGDETPGETNDPTTTEDTSSDDADSTDPDDAGDDPSDTSPAEPEPEDIGDPCETDADCSESLFCEDSKCVAGRDEACSPGVPCAAGHNCVQTAAGASCLEICEETTSCRAAERCWAQGEGSLLGELGGHCFPNLCGPADNFGILRPAEFMGACDAAGTGDGICFGPIAESQLGPIGACMNASGEIAAGSPCDPTVTQADQAGLCAAGTCSPLNICATFCDTQAESCEAWADGTETSCQSLGDDELASDAGLCFPNPAAEEDSEDEDAADSEDSAAGDGEG